MSDKTTAAIAAEQQAEAPEAPAEALPAVTLDELEQVDLGTVEQGERAPFRIFFLFRHFRRFTLIPFQTVL